MLSSYYYDWLIKVDSEGREIWNRTFATMNLCSSGRCPFNPGYTYAKRKSDGAYLELSGQGHFQVYSIQLAADGGYILAGETTANSGGASLIKINTGGRETWNRTFNKANGFECIWSVNPTPDDGYILAGFTQNSKGDYDAWLIKVAPG